MHCWKVSCGPPVHICHSGKGCQGEAEVWALPGGLGRLCVRGGGEKAPRGAHSVRRGAEVNVDGTRSTKCREETDTCVIEPPQPSATSNEFNTLEIWADTLWKYFKSKD